MDYIEEFTAKLHNLDHSKQVHTVFKDFLTLSTCALAQPVYRSDELEQKYLDTIKNYTKEQANEFSKLLALLVSALTEKHQDFLGQVYMSLNLGSSAKGQFFTPYHISKFMAEINFTDTETTLKKDEFLTLSEPCCGSGGMIIAFAETMKEHKFNYQTQLFAEATDIDEICFMMAYIQLSLYGISAKVMLGDTLAYKFSKVLYTPMYFINGIGFKLKEHLSKNETNIIQEPQLPDVTMQLSLF